jgi:hypothetical protein
MSEEQMKLGEGHVGVVARLSALLGEGWEFRGSREYMGGVQLNWKRGNASVMWRDEHGEDLVEFYDREVSMHVMFKTFEELREMR